MGRDSFSPPLPSSCILCDPVATQGDFVFELNTLVSDFPELLGSTQFFSLQILALVVCPRQGQEGENELKEIQMDSGKRSLTLGSEFLE